MLRIPFSAPKSLRIPARRACHRLSPLCHRSLFGRKSAQKRPQFRNSFSAGFSAVRQPAEDLLGVRQPRWSVSPPSLSPLTSPLRPAPFLVQKALKTVESEEFVFPCRTASGTPEPQVSLVFGRKQAPDSHFAQDSAFGPEFQPAKLVTVRHRFVTASSPLSSGPKSAQKDLEKRNRLRGFGLKVHQSRNSDFGPSFPISPGKSTL